MSEKFFISRGAGEIPFRVSVGVPTPEGAFGDTSKTLGIFYEREDAELFLKAKEGGVWKDITDLPLPEDAEIEAAFPTRSGEHAIYAEAQRLVSARYSKFGLVALVNMLLHRIAKARGGW